MIERVVIHAAKDLRVEERALEPLGSGQVEVTIEAGGITTSWWFGTVRVREPMMLGHEVAGTIKALGQAFPILLSEIAWRDDSILWCRRTVFV